jgi:hypothetical protein
VRAPLALPLLSLWLPLAAACRSHEPPPAPPAVAPRAARPSEFVHPPIPPEPTKSARAECSGEALVQVAARVREAQQRAARGAEPASRNNNNNKKKSEKRTKARIDQGEGCGSPAMTELDREVKGPLLDRIRICVAQDEPFDPEWNLLDAGMASLGVCMSCGRVASDRAADCRRVAELVSQAEAGARKAPPPPR